MAGRPVSLARHPPLLADREELLAGLGDRVSGGAAGGLGIIALHGGPAKRERTSLPLECPHCHTKITMADLVQAKSRTARAGQTARAAS